MRDRIQLLINKNLITNFISCSFDSDLFLAADAFSIEMMPGAFRPRCGMRVECYVNNRIALTGYISKIESKIQKSGRSLAISGMDRMGILCGHDITEFGEDTDLSNLSFIEIVRLLLRDVPGVNTLNDVIFQGKSAGFAIPYDLIKQEHGQTVFDVLKTISAGRGLLFWCTEEGKFVFGKPVSAGPAVFSFSRTNNFTNILESSLVEDIADGFSKVFVYGQSQDVSTDESGNILNSLESNSCETASLSVPDEFPFYKPKCITLSGNSTVCRREAQRQINISKAKALAIEYTVAGHSYKGTNYKTNVIVNVNDDKEEIHGDFLLYGRTFTINKNTGPLTTVRLGRPGIILE